MKVLVLNGSPKAERSNTLNITKAFLKGFPADTEVEQITSTRRTSSPAWAVSPAGAELPDSASSRTTCRISTKRSRLRISL